MITIPIVILQIIAGLGIYNVWLVRPKQSTMYRGKGAPNIKQEFLAYGLPAWSVYVVGGLKLASATALLIGIWYPILVPYASSLLSVLMMGAVAMHLKVGDTLKQTWPAMAMLTIALMIAITSLRVFLL